jgi:hypothetical protein
LHRLGDYAAELRGTQSGSGINTLRALRPKLGSAEIMKIREILDNQVERSDAKIKQLDRTKSQEKIRKKQAQISNLRKDLAQS